MKVNFSNHRAHKDNNPWLNQLAMEFLCEHDIIGGTKTRLWFRTREGCKSFVEWLKDKAWDVSYWELPPLIENDKETYLAFGLDIKENCPEFIAYKLKM